MQILHLYLSVGHNFFGHHDLPPGQHPMQEVSEIECVAGRGIRGDRFFDYQPDYKGQITFFSQEVYRELCNEFGIEDRPPSVFRRNVITQGIDLRTLYKEEFECQGVRFIGSGECAPCYWMETAFCTGAEARLAGFGGLRARIVKGGKLRTSDR